MSGTRRIAVFAFSFFSLLAVALDATAQTRSEVLRWRDDVNTDVIGYRVHFGEASRSYTTTLDVGIPPVVSGAFQTSVSVPADSDIYFAVTAYNAAAESFYSNERCRGPSGECGSPPPPPPPPPPPGDGGGDAAQAAIVGFALWNAQSDTLINSDFSSGDQILLANNDCVAIEILGNEYLDQSSAGSIKKVFDGQDPGACNDPGVTHENQAPFAWEADQGTDKFPCAASLTQPGSHTLTVTPFDGDDCSGAMGTPVTLEFSVVAPPPPAATLGQPGQPQLIQ